MSPTLPRVSPKRVFVPPDERCARVRAPEPSSLFSSRVLPPRVRRLTFVAVVVLCVVEALSMDHHAHGSGIYPPKQLAFFSSADAFVKTSSGGPLIVRVVLRRSSSWPTADESSSPPLEFVWGARRPIFWPSAMDMVSRVEGECPARHLCPNECSFPLSSRGGPSSSGCPRAPAS